MLSMPKQTASSVDISSQLSSSGATLKRSAPSAAAGNDDHDDEIERMLTNKRRNV